ncbi:MAG TPA: hypothetical protein VFV27_04970 [Nevskiaceae bacterium]|nr:hypothetical protein [Nevskiaceae bacterium]
MTRSSLLAVLLSCGLLSACGSEGNPFGEGKNGLQDALNLRDNEKLKDAAEDAADALEAAAEGVKEAVEDATGDGD